MQANKSISDYNNCYEENETGKCDNDCVHGCVCVCVCVCVRMCPYPLTTLDDVAKEASLRRWLLNSGQVVEGGASFENSMQ